MARHVDPLNALLSKARATKGRQKGDKRATRARGAVPEAACAAGVWLQPAAASRSGLPCMSDCALMQSARPQVTSHPKFVAAPKAEVDALLRARKAGNPKAAHYCLSLSDAHAGFLLLACVLQTRRAAQAGAGAGLRAWAEGSTQPERRS